MNMKWLLFLPCSLFCLSAGNPSFPQMGEKGIFSPSNAPLTVRIGYEGEWINHRKMEDFHDLSNVSQAGIVTLNWIDRIEAYGGVGEGKLKNTSSCLYWLVGGRLLLNPFDLIHVGLNASYFHENDLSGWQVAVGASYPLGAFYPYLSFVTEETYYSSYQSKKNMGGAIGLGFSPRGPFDLNIEGRFVGEVAFSLSARLRL